MTSLYRHTQETKRRGTRGQNGRNIWLALAEDIISSVRLGTQLLLLTRVKALPCGAFTSFSISPPHLSSPLLSSLSLSTRVHIFCCRGFAFSFPFLFQFFFFRFDQALGYTVDGGELHAVSASIAVGGRYSLQPWVDSVELERLGFDCWELPRYLSTLGERDAGNNDFSVIIFICSSPLDDFLFLLYLFRLPMQLFECDDVLVIWLLSLCR